MMNELQKFMAAAVADQMKTAGESVLITRPKSQGFSLSATAVISARDGTLDAAVGGAVVAITGHALIAASSIVDAGSSSNNYPKAGDVLSQTNGDKWLIINAIQSSNDCGISCDLVRKQ